MSSVSGGAAGVTSATGVEGRRSQPAGEEAELEGLLLGGGGAGQSEWNTRL